MNAQPQREYEMYDMQDLNGEDISDTWSESSVASSDSDTERRISLGYNRILYNIDVTIDTETASPFRLFAIRLVGSRKFAIFMLIMIIINVSQTALLAVPNVYAAFGSYFVFSDFAFQGLYTAEMILKVYAWRKIFVYSGFNILDMILIFFGYLDWIRYIHYTAAFARSLRYAPTLRFFRIIRVIRCLRILRIIVVFDKLQILMSTLLRSLPAMSAVGFLLAIVMYISSVIATALYGGYYPTRFGSIGSSLMTCFQLLTLDDGFTFYDIVSVYDKSIGVFLIAYIIVAAFVINQMLIAIIMNNLEETQTQMLGREKKAARRRRMIRDGLNLAQRFGDKSNNRKAPAKKEMDSAHLGAQRKILDYYNRAVTETSDRERQLMMQYFMLLAAAENESLWYQNQREVMDKMVDKLVEQGLI